MITRLGGESLVSLRLKDARASSLFAARIRTSGYTSQQEFADAMGVSKGFVSQILGRTKNLTNERLNQWVVAAKIPPDELDGMFVSRGSRSTRGRGMPKTSPNALPASSDAGDRVA